MNDKTALASETGHSTSGEAGRMASLAGATCLITGHYSSRYDEIDPILEEAREHFSYVLGAEEGKTYNLRDIAKGLKH